MAHIRRLVLTLAVACISSLAFGRGNLKELTVPLKYTPQDTTSADLPPSLRDQSVEVRSKTRASSPTHWSSVTARKRG
jgi:hypothetical protein